MTTSRTPYLLNAMYEWIYDNNLTPHIVVTADENLNVPTEHINEGKVVLNIDGNAANDLELGKEFVSFSARFSGKRHDLLIPVENIQCIYAKETGQGMIFAHSEEAQPDPEPERKKPVLSIVK